MIPTNLILQGFFFLLFSLGISLTVQAQNRQPDTLRTRRNTPSRAIRGRGSPSSASTTQKADSNNVHFTAKDSLVFTLQKERVATLYGNAKVDYKQNNLTSGKVSLDLDTNIMSAQAINPADTLSQPVLTRNKQKIRSEKVRFDYKTNTGKFTVAHVDIPQGNLIGMQVKNKTQHVVFIKNAIYSICELPHPHFYIKAKRMKVVNQKEIFFTNARLYILDIPYPIPLPFGFVPAKMDRKRSGLLAPSYAYQQQQSRGLGLRNLGWFQYFNDHLTGELDFGIYTSGTFYGTARVNYAKTDKYNGSMEFDYSLDQGLEPTDPDYAKSVQRRISISHHQTISPYANFNASINVSTNNFFQRNSLNINDRAKVQNTSNISYQYNQPDNLFNFSATMAQSQDFAKNAVTLSGPDLQFNLKTLSPFQSENPAKTRWYQTLSISYGNSFQSQYQFTPLQGDSSKINWISALFNPRLYREATGSIRNINAGFQQNVSTSIQFLPSSDIHMTGSLSGTEYWYPSSVREYYEPDSMKVITKMVPGFTAAHQFNTSLSLNTRLYGIWNTHIGNIYGFRHTLSPTISFSYRPDFSTPFWGSYRTVQTDSMGDMQKYPIFQGSVIGGPGSGKVEAIGLNLSNILEMKQVKRDTTGEKKEKIIKLIDNLNVSTGYNFAAKQFNLSNLNTSFSSSIINDVNISAAANFSFYGTDKNGTTINKYLLSQTGHLMRLTSFSIQSGTSFRGGEGRGSGFTTPHYYYPAHYDPFNQRYFSPYDPMFNEIPVEPFDVPWSFSLSFSYSWNKFGNKVNQNAVLNAQNITFSPTPQWHVSTSLGYDFIQKRLTPAQFIVNRKLHHWNLSFMFNPFGNSQYYVFSLTISGSQFQSLLQKLPGLNLLEQSNSPISRSGGGYFSNY